MIQAKTDSFLAGTTEMLRKVNKLIYCLYFLMFSAKIYGVKY